MILLSPAPSASVLACGPAPGDGGHHRLRPGPGRRIAESRPETAPDRQGGFLLV